MPCHADGAYLESVPSAPVEDDLGEVPFGFIDIARATVTLSDDAVSFEMVLSDMPSTLARNEATSNRMEYGWSADFDVDGDGTAANDIGLSHLSFAMGEPESEAFGTFGQTNVWLNAASGGGNVVGQASLAVDGPTLAVTARRDAYEGLASIDEATPVRFWTTHHADGYSCDALPGG